ncbi:putative signal transduction protein with CBS domains [Methanococcus vannielii SB]|uniref:Signal transduction protein with CBS domains n=1 Tax=Methanococcus vannielii (strain ATCC 35089 / DSM 1224 / JCM 13029 / OCM 148 / SB) TaxID=406327 RepID=A6UN56_METVS|nr:CBS domain-containing protein [Methanococcus vannielii]ABR53928.1 putative signal transduction protein with CBS domains [Methanococcus vannielii SB]
MKVSEIMNPVIFTVEGEKSIYAAFKLMHEKGIRRVFVTVNERIEGIISYRDLVNVLFNKGVFELIDMQLKDIFTKEILTISDSAEVEHAAQLMLHADVSGLLVLDSKNDPLGVVSQTDILRALVKGV